MSERKLLQKAIAIMLALSMIFGSALQTAAEILTEGKADNDTSVAMAAETGESSTELDTYLQNQGELAKSELMQLPVGAVRPEGWLENQLLLMKNGITGLMKDHNNYNYSSSAWLNGTSGEAWEKGPYFARGITAMAYVLDDEELLDEAMDWVTAILDSQQANGFFGPASNTDWWARMPALNVIRDFYEGVEAKPVSERTEEEKEYFEKVIPFFESYFRYELGKLPSQNLDDSWGKRRAADNVEIVYWLYNHQYDAADPEKTAWLLDLVDEIWRQATKWNEEADNSTVRHHVVNTTQGLKFSPILSLYDQDNQSLREGFAKTLDNIGLDHGRIDGIANADEMARDNQSTRGTELCSVAEAIVSAGIALEVYDEAWIGDWIETLAYNSLPAAYPAEYSGQSYFVQQNQPITTLGIHEFTQDYGNGTAYGAPGGFECCFPNNHMAWAKFVQNMWMATESGGLALTAYGPNTVTAKVADGKTALFKQTTDYPFKNTVQLEYLGETAAFDLRLRVPEWAKGVIITVNGASQKDIVSGEFYEIVREWKEDDKVQITFESEVELTRWYNNSTAVQYGALIYSLQIEEDWRTYDSSDISGVASTNEQPQREVYPASAWNYGLVTDENAVFEVVEGNVGLQPFTAENAPVSIKAKGVQIDEWTLDGNNAGVQLYGPIRYNENEIEDITLIPYGCTNIRITHMPTMNNTESTDHVIREDCRIIKRSGVTYQDFDNIIVPSADNYNLKITAEGTGTMIINTNYTQEITGNTVVENLKDLSGLNGYFQFKEGQYNNIRFTGGIKVSKIEVEIVDKTIEDVRVLSVNREKQYGRLTTNLDALETPYEVCYGTESGEYTNSVTGFDSSVAVLYDLNRDTTYYAVVKAIVNGERMTSSEVVLSPYTGPGEIILNPNAVKAEYTGFVNAEEVKKNWSFIDTDSVASVVDTEGGARIQIGKSADIKAYLNTKDSGYWTDYSVEAEITITENPTNNAGIIFRASNMGVGSDTYRGYYFGIGQGGLTVGYAEGSMWRQVDQIAYTVRTGQTYTLKAVVYDTMFAVYVDGQLMKVYELNLFPQGTVGVRSYNVPFHVDDVRVRSLVDADLAVFKEYRASQEELGVTPSFSENFENGNTGAWTLLGDTSRINIQNGQIEFGSSTNVKAVAGSTGWTDYVVSADIHPGAGSDINNAGIMLRVTEPREGADGYNGYYFGINATSYCFGRADGAWVFIEHPSYNVGGGSHRLKVVASGNTFLCYIDEKLITVIEDDHYANGQIGLRSYNCAFTADNVEVREINAAEEADLKAYGEREVTISAVSSDGTIQIKYPGMGGANKVRIVYGTESGVYTDAYEDLPCRDSLNKVAFSVPNGTYYVKLYMMSGNSVAARSNEIKVTTGYRESVSNAKAKMMTKLEAAEKCDVTAFSSVSKQRLEASIQYAQTVLAKENANQIEFALAEDLLAVSINNPNTEYPTGIETGGDKSALKEALEESKDSSDYTAASWALYAEKVAAAKEILEDKNATQADIDTVLAELDVLVEKTASDNNNMKLAASYDMTVADHKLVDNSGNNKDASLVGNTIETPVIGGQDAVFVLSGDDYAELPAGLIEGEVFAVEATFKTSTRANAFLWCFGTRMGEPADNYIFLAPKAGIEAGGINAPVRTGIKVGTEVLVGNGAAGEIANNTYTTIRMEFNNGNMKIYVDGKLTGEAATRYRIQDILAAAQAATPGVSGFIGKSVWTPDPLFKGTLTQLDIYVENTEEPEVDKAALQAAVAAAKDADLNVKEYTEDSWKVYADALEAAEDLLNDADATQKEVDAAVKDLTVAKANLKKIVLPYEDVTKDDWFYDAVFYNYIEETMTGLDKTHFGPYGQLSRAQFALILYRIEGEPKVDTDKSFPDIAGSEWYGQAVLWAAENGIVTGYQNGYFGPVDLITREQMAVMMYRYAKYLEEDVTTTGELDKFHDVDQVSPFASDAMSWANGKGIITGKENGTMLDPQGATARAEAAAIIQRFMSAYAK